MSIKSKILFWFLLPFILISITSTVSGYFYIRNIIKQNIFDQLEVAADELKKHVELFLKERKSRVLDFSSDGFIRNCTDEITGKESRKEHYTSTLNDHLITNKKSISRDILEVFVVDLNGKVIASTNEGHIGEDVSGKKYFDEVEFRDTYTSRPHYDLELNEKVIEFSSILLSKIGRVEIGIIVNRIKYDYQNDNVHESASSPQSGERAYSELIVANRVRIMDFSSDGFIKDCTEEITRREEKVQEYTNRLNLHLAINKQPLDPDLLAVFVVDLAGTIVGTSEFGLLGKNVSKKHYFINTMKHGSYIGNLYHNSILNLNMFEATRLILSMDEKMPIGVIVNRYVGNSLKNITRSGISELLEGGRLGGLGKTGEVYIVNKDRLMITESRFIKNTILNQAVDTEGVMTAFNNGKGMIGIYTGYRGIRTLGVSRYIKEMDWVILAERDVSEVFTPITRLRNFVIIMGTLGIVVAVIIAYILATGITKPIIKLATSASTIAKGDLTRHINVKSKGEIGHLADSFETMRIELVKLLNNLEYAKRDWESTFDAVLDIIMLFDKDYRLVRCNKTLLSKFKLKYEDIVGKKCNEIFHCESGFIDEGVMKEIAQTLMPVRKETGVTHLDSVFAISCFPRFDGKGKLTGFVQYLRDITERKLAEHEKKKLIIDLETKNAELERFSYTISHDLKSPLVTIRGFLDLLEGDIVKGDAERIKGDINHIRNASGKMGRLLEELLKLSRIGRVVNPPQEISLVKLTHEAIGLVAGQLDESDVQVDVSPDLPVIYGDRSRLIEVMQNLIDNAVKYMGGQSRPHIEIGSRQDGKETICYVRDNGIGIGPRYHEKIFGLFDRLDQEVDGTGVGLALVRRIIESHGGRIWVESEGQGKGCTFCFTVPQKQ